MDKVEKFKELLSDIKILSFRLNGCFNAVQHKKIVKESIELEEKLLKMFKEALNEKIE